MVLILDWLLSYIARNAFLPLTCWQARELKKLCSFRARVVPACGVCRTLQHDSVESNLGTVTFVLAVWVMMWCYDGLDVVSLVPTDGVLSRALRPRVVHLPSTWLSSPVWTT